MREDRPREGLRDEEEPSRTGPYAGRPARRGTVIVCELTRLSRSTKDLFELIERINASGADIRSLKEPWLDTTTLHGKLLFTISAGISQFERDLTHERTMDGLAATRARGRLGGRPKTDEKRLRQAMAMYMLTISR